LFGDDEEANAAGAVLAYVLVGVATGIDAAEIGVPRDAPRDCGGEACAGAGMLPFVFSDDAAAGTTCGSSFNVSSGVLRGDGVAAVRIGGCGAAAALIGVATIGACVGEIFAANAIDDGFWVFGLFTVFTTDAADAFRIGDVARCGLLAALLKKTGLVFVVGFRIGACGLSI